MTVSVEKRPRDHRYTRLAIILHWTIAAFIIFNLAVGFFMEGLPLPYRAIVVVVHISSGFTVLALTVLRVIWRLIHEPPAYPAGMSRGERHLAHFAHFLLYLAMVLMPLTGWAIISAHPPAGSPGALAAVAQKGPGSPPPGLNPARPAPPAGLMKIWGLIPIPTITPILEIGEKPGGVAPQHKLHEDFVKWHSIGGYMLLALLLLHVAGALKHQLVDKQAELQRMGIGRTRPDLR